MGAERPGSVPGAPGASLRLFVGVRVGSACRAALGRAVRRLADADDALRPVAEADLHVTLQFLGTVPEERVAAISDALALAARRHAPIDVRYRGLGAFPSAAAPRVLWAGMDGQAALAALAEEVGRVLRPLGFEGEKRAFSAHVTLARVRDGRRVNADTARRLERAREAEYGADRLSDLKLILSPVGAGGYAYKDLTSWALSGSVSSP